MSNLLDAVMLDPLGAYQGVLDSELRHNGHSREFLGFCPFHNDTHRSLRVHIDKATWYCDPCGKGGGLLDLAAHKWSDTKAGAASRLAKMLGVSESDQLQPRATREVTARKLVHTIRYEVCNLVGELKATHVRYEYNDGSKSMPWEPAGIKPHELPLYAINRTCDSADGDLVVVTEGEKAADTLWERRTLAVGTVTGAGYGKPIPCDESLKLLLRFKVILWPDNDDVGRDHMQRIGKQLHELGHPQLFVVDWKEGPQHGDAADYHGDIDALLDSAVEFVLGGIRGADVAASLNGSATLTPVSEIHPRTVTWLWEGRIPLGKIAVIAGDPGLGKSFLTLDMAARVISNQAWPDGAPACDGNVILVSAEDDPSDTIRPRLDALGADVSRVHILEGIRDRSGERGFNLTDTGLLETAIAKIGKVVAVFIDPVSAYLGGTDSHKNSDVRALLAPLAKVASTAGVAIVCVTHLSKSAADPLNRLSGSIAFGAAARSVWLVSRDPEQHERRLMLALKNNLASEPDGLAFAIRATEQGAPVVAWERDPVTITAAEHLRELRDEADRARQELPIEDACDLLRSMLRNGPRPVVEVCEEATRRGISERTLKRARKLLGVESSRDGFGKDGGWVLQLPAKGGQATESSSTSESGTLYRSPSLPMGSLKGANSSVNGENGPDMERV